MHVRTTPTSKGKKDCETIARKAGPKKQPKKRASAVRQGLPLSTNVSSPVQNTSKRRIRQFQCTEREDEDEDWEDDLDISNTKQRSKYVRDDFCVSDRLEQDELEDDDEFFEPVRQFGRPLARREMNESFGPRIETDEQMDRLNPIHRLVVEDFMRYAKHVCQKLVVEKNLRAAPFPDTMLREMGIRLPKNTEEMLGMSGIDPEKVSLYGSRFLKLIRKAENSYRSMMSVEADRPMDPNHRTVHNVVDLVSDEELAGDDDINDDSFGSSPEEQSSYFQEQRMNSDKLQRQERSTKSNKSVAGLDGGLGRNEAHKGSSRSTKHRARAGSDGSKPTGSGFGRKKSFRKKGSDTASNKVGKSARTRTRSGGQKGNGRKGGGINMMPM